MKNNDSGTATTRSIYILRLWRNSPQGRWIVEIQNVKTGDVVHLLGLEAIAGYLEESVQAISDQPRPDIT